MSSEGRSISVPYSSEEDLVFLLSRLGAVTRSRLADTLSSLDLTPRQFVVLKILSRHDGLSQAELSQRLGIDTSSIVHVIDDCERSGLAERQRRSEDRRRYAVSLTQKGEEQLRSAQSSVDEFSDELLAPLDTAERNELRSLLLTVASAHGPAARTSRVSEEASIVG
ncbi:MAG: MarR family transcriptional regulator [Actinomycetota bacterium]